MTRPTTCAASSTTRKTMIAVANIASAYHQKASARRAEIVEELVTAGLERADEDAGRAAGRHHLLAMQRGALEFGRGRLFVADLQFDPNPRGKPHPPPPPFVSPH